MSHDYTLTFLRENYQPKEITLKLYVATAYMGSMSLEDLCQSPELLAEIPKSLVRAFLRDYTGEVDTDEVSLDALLMLVEFAEDEDGEEEEK